MNNNRFYRQLVAAFSAWILFSAGSAFAVPGDEHWSVEFGWPGTLDTVYAIAPHNNRIYAGGYTNSVGSNTTVIVWDGIQWSNLGLFKGTSGTSIYDLAFAGDTLYAAGFFTNVDGAAIKGLARWDGNSWSGIGFNGTALCLAANGTDLYVGGIFTNTGPVAATNIARWDGSAWHALANGLGRSNAAVRAIVITNGIVYAGGNYTNSGSLAISNLAGWDGSSWSSVGGGVNSTVTTLAMKGTDLYAAGTFTQAGSTLANTIARWDGTNWFSVGSGFSGGVVVNMASFGNLLCVIGNFTSVNGVSAAGFATWDGVSWSPAGNGISASGLRVAATSTNVYLGGNFLLAGVKITASIASWDGTDYGIIGAAGQSAGLSTTVRAITGDGTNLLVGGSFTSAGQTNALRIGRYDGTHWYAVGTGLNNNVTSVAIVGTNFYAGGDFTGDNGTGPLAFHMARWDGINWVSLSNTAFTTVSALASRGTDLYIAGYFGSLTTNNGASWLARWDGTNFWNVLNYQIPYGYNIFYLDGIGFTAMAMQDNTIYLSGHFVIGECDPANNCTNCLNVMRFDGTYGRVIGTGLNTNATSIAVAGTNVFFAGPNLTNAGGITVNGIGQWDGNVWSNPGGGVVGSGSISALAAIGTNLYAGGSFTNIGGIPSKHIARWDGNTWSALGSGTIFTGNSGPVLALTAVGQDLYVGGTFRTAGGKPSYFLARWNESQNFDPKEILLYQPSGGRTNAFRAALTAVGVTNYVIEGSANLSTWTPLLTNTITPYDFIDSNAPALPRQFYRARSNP